MIPMLVALHIRGRHSVSLWLPLFLLWLLLLPLLLILLPLAVIAFLVVRINAWRAVFACWDLLAGARGMHVEIASPDHFVFIHVY